eukprot:9484812-Pyramimonas_sp.AAC.1
MEQQLQQQQQQIAELLQTVQRLQQQQQQREAAGQAPGQPVRIAQRFEGVIDAKIIGKVKQFDGSRAGWSTWEFHWRAYMVANDKRYRDFFEKLDDKTLEQLEDAKNATMRVDTSALHAGARDARRLSRRDHRAQRPARRGRPGMDLTEGRVCTRRAWQRRSAHEAAHVHAVRAEHGRGEPD